MGGIPPTVERTTTKASDSSPDLRLFHAINLDLQGLGCHEKRWYPVTMKLNAVAITAHSIPEAVAFHELLGFKFDVIGEDEEHVEARHGDIKLMIDSEEMVESILCAKPVPANHSTFALEYDSPEDVNSATSKLTEAGYVLVKEPWDAFWGQRYAIARDPNGYMVDLYAYLPAKTVDLL